MEKDEILSGFVLELRRGTIILCVLGILKTPAYGYSLIGRLAEAGIAVEANTLYPLLRRLEGQGLLQGTWNTDAAKPRKYYAATELGNEMLELLKGHFAATVESVNKLLEGENDA